MAKYIFGGKKSIIIPSGDESYFAQLYLEGQDPTIFIIIESTIALSINIDAGKTLGDIPYFTVLGDNIIPAELKGIIPLYVCNKSNIDILDYYYTYNAKNRSSPLIFNVFYGLKVHTYYAIIRDLTLYNTASDADVSSFIMTLLLIDDLNNLNKLSKRYSNKSQTQKQINPMLINWNIKWQRAQRLNLLHFAIGKNLIPSDWDKWIPKLKTG